MMPSVAVSICKAAAAHDGASLVALDRLRADMQSELDAAYDRIEQLQDIIGLRQDVPASMKLPPYPKKIFGIVLKATGWVSVETIETALYGHLPECDWPKNPRGSIKVHVRHLRDRLDVYGIELDTIYAASGTSGGYWMSPDMKARARSILAGGRVHDESQIASPHPVPLRKVPLLPTAAAGE